MTPLGIIIGSGSTLTLSDSAHMAFETLFDSLAAGTFPHIATMDIIREEFIDRLPTLTKYLFLLPGLGLMALLAIWL